MKEITKQSDGQDLELQKLQLYWLLQITKAINYNIPASGLYEIYQKVTRDHLKIECLSLIVKGEVWKQEIGYGLSLPMEQDHITEYIEHAGLFGDLDAELPEWLGQFDTIIPVLHKDKPLAYAFIGKLDHSVFQNRRDASSFLHTITNVITVAIENKRLVKESLQQAAVQRELELAAQMQSMLFPSDLHLNGFMDIAATYIPHQQIGGDYYDFIKLNEDEAILCMADVSGKGVSAALLMSNFQANLHALVKYESSLTEIVDQLNACVNKSAKGEKFITFFIAKVNRITRELIYINAGHHPPAIVMNNKTESLDVGTTGLGMFEELPFLNEGKVHFPAGSILFLYTDGIPEMENNEGQAFGNDLLMNLLTNNLNIESMNHLHHAMIDEFNRFREDRDFTDDVTFLSCRLFL